MKDFIERAIQQYGPQGEFVLEAGLEPDGAEAEMDDSPLYGILVNADNESIEVVAFQDAPDGGDDPTVIAAEDALATADSAADGIDLEMWLLSDENAVYVGDPQETEDGILFGPYTGKELMRVVGLAGQTVGA